MQYDVKVIIIESMLNSPSETLFCLNKENTVQPNIANRINCLIGVMNMKINPEDHSNVSFGEQTGFQINILCQCIYIVADLPKDHGIMVSYI